MFGMPNLPYLGSELAQAHFIFTKYHGFFIKFNIFRKLCISVSWRKSSWLLPKVFGLPYRHWNTRTSLQTSAWTWTAPEFWSGSIWNRLKSHFWNPWDSAEEFWTSNDNRIPFFKNQLKINSFISFAQMIESENRSFSLEYIFFFFGDKTRLACWNWYCCSWKIFFNFFFKNLWNWML